MSKLYFTLADRMTDDRSKLGECCRLIKRGPVKTFTEIEADALERLNAYQSEASAIQIELAQAQEAYDDAKHKRLCAQLAGIEEPNKETE